MKVKSSGSKAMCSGLLICYVYAKKPYMSRNVLALDKVGVKLKNSLNPHFRAFLSLLTLIGIKIINVTKCPVSYV